MFLSLSGFSGDRWEASRLVKLRRPGPGRYEVAREVAHPTFNRLLRGAQTRGRMTNMGFVSGEERFADLAEKGRGRHGVSPGPGAYDVGQPMASKTFNCLFGDVI